MSAPSQNLGTPRAEDDAATALLRALWNGWAGENRNADDVFGEFGARIKEVLAASSEPKIDDVGDLLRKERGRVFAILRHGKEVEDPDEPGTTIMVDWDDLEEGIAAVESGRDFPHLEAAVEAVVPFVRSLEGALASVEAAADKANNPKAVEAARTAASRIRTALDEIAAARARPREAVPHVDAARRMLERVRRALGREDKDAVLRSGARIGDLVGGIGSVIDDGRGETVPLDAAGKALAAISREPRTYSWNGSTHTILNPKLTDIEVAGKVRMLMRDDLSHESVCTLARDRIVHLSERLAEVETILACGGAR